MAEREQLLSDFVAWAASRRGADLSKPYRHAFDYWVRLVANRTQYVVLCNFDEFWVCDYNNKLDSPEDKDTRGSDGVPVSRDLAVEHVRKPKRALLSLATEAGNGSQR